MSSSHQLNPAQVQAVQTVNGPVMILAGAGSGKTRTLVARISHLMDELQVSPHQLLALTFSNKAAREMRERVSSQCGLNPRVIPITTFHSFCAQVLRNEFQYLGLSRNFTIYDESESKSIVKTLLSARGVAPKELPPSNILHFISEIKNIGHYEGRSSTDSEIDKDHEFYQYFTEYERELHRSNALDFGGLITAVIELFEKHPTVLKRYQERYRYIMVDEYQDTNRAQFDLICLLSAGHRNLCVVGDEDQSIYSWRGADIRNILDFEKIFPDAMLIKLEENYRSSKKIIEAATHVIAKNQMRKGKTMFTRNLDGEAIEILECGSDREEAEKIVSKVKELRDSGVSPEDMAIFYRSNAQSRLIEDNLRRFDIPYRVVGGIRFYERKEIKDILGYLRLIVNTKDSLAFSRIINAPPRGIGATTLRKIEQEATDQNCSLFEVVEKIVAQPASFIHLKLSSKAKSSLFELESLLQEAKLDSDRKAHPSWIYEKILSRCGYIEFLQSSKDYENLARLENLQELGNAIKQFAESEEHPTLAGFLETITLDTSTKDENPEKEIALMTIHSAKGLEFPYVFVAGLEENVFPSYQSLEAGTETSIEEERRLFYVAMTRAMKKLFLCFAQGRMLFGQLKFNAPSRFLFEIPENYYHWPRKRKVDEDHDDDGLPIFRTDRTAVTTSKPRPTVVPDLPKAKFQKGQRIRHQLYGAGMVLHSEGYGPEEKVLIKFPTGETKKFMVKFAPIELA